MLFALFKSYHNGHPLVIFRLRQRSRDQESRDENKDEGRRNYDR